MLGGSGFVGTHLCAALARDGWRIPVPTRDPGQWRVEERVTPPVPPPPCAGRDLAAVPPVPVLEKEALLMSLRRGKTARQLPVSAKPHSAGVPVVPAGGGGK